MLFREFLRRRDSAATRAIAAPRVRAPADTRLSTYTYPNQVRVLEILELLGWAGRSAVHGVLPGAEVRPCRWARLSMAPPRSQAGVAFVSTVSTNASRKSVSTDSPARLKILVSAHPRRTTNRQKKSLGSLTHATALCAIPPNTELLGANRRRCSRPSDR